MPVNRTASPPAESGTVLDLSRTPRIGNSQVVIWSAAAADVYGANHPGENDDSRVAFIKGDGTTTQFTLPSDITLPLDGTITDENRLNVIVEVRDSSSTGVSLPVRLDDGSGSPSAGNFRVVDANTISIGALAKNQVAVVLLPYVSQLTGGTLDAGREYDVASPDYITASEITNITGARGF